MSNFALDAIRVLEHIDAVKGFRPRADADSSCGYIPRHINSSRNKVEDGVTRSKSDEDKLRFRFTKSDSLHIIRAVSLFMRRGWNRF